MKFPEKKERDTKKIHPSPRRGGEKDLFPHEKGYAEDFRLLRRGRAFFF